MAHVAPRKKEIVADLTRRFLESKVVGIASIQGIPAPQFQAIRRSLAGRVTITVSKNNLIRLALKEAASKRSNLDELTTTIEGQTAVVLAEVNPFRLYKEFEATKTKAPARGGEVAPEDLWAREGETPFKPGPVVGELQKAGVPAAIERGKVVIKKDKLLVKAGDRIPRDIAQVLTRLEIYPLTVGLDLRSAYEGGKVFRREALAIDEVKVRAQFVQAGLAGFKLAMVAAYPTRVTIRPLLAQAHQRALSLVLEASYPTKGSIALLLSKAQAQMLALARRVPGALDEELRNRLGAPAVPPPRAVEPEKPKEEKKEPTEEEAASGLSTLFG